MANKFGRILPLLGGGFAIVSAMVGCSSGDDNSPTMGAVPPKPNPNMNANLPPEVRNQIAQAKPGSDARQMGGMKSRVSKP